MRMHARMNFSTRRDEREHAHKAECGHYWSFAEHGLKGRLTTQTIHSIKVSQTRSLERLFTVRMNWCSRP